MVASITRIADCRSFAFWVTIGPVCCALIRKAQRMPGPLHGFRIVDLTSNVSGPFGTMILGDQGADVIKVEAPDGDSTRAGANRRGGFSASFLNNNRNKRSLVLNLKDPGALRVLMRLVATADVFVQNYRPGVAER